MCGHKGRKSIPAELAKINDYKIGHITVYAAVISRLNANGKPQRWSSCILQP